MRGPCFVGCYDIDIIILLIDIVSKAKNAVPQPYHVSAVTVCLGRGHAVWP